MANYDSRMELATRDVVSNAIANEMLHSKNDNIYIYCRHLESTDFKNEFPTIIKKCVSKGCIITIMVQIPTCFVGVNSFKDLIPITPEAHYLCGGITVDMVGKTSLKNLPELSKVTIAIGPESGFSTEELHWAYKNNWHSYSLGPRILRTETATAAALAAIQLIRGDI